jgi:hypothetical protein
VLKNSTYTIIGIGIGIPGTTVTVHFHKAGTAATDYSILRTTVVGRTGTWSRSYVAGTDYRFYAVLKAYGSDVYLDEPDWRCVEVRRCWTQLCR